MNLRDELRKRFTAPPPEVAEPARKLEAALEEAQRAKSQLAEVQAELAEAQRVKFRLVEEQPQLQALLAAVQAQLAEAQAYIAELKRQLFGSKAEPLSAEQEAQLQQLAKDLQEQAQRPGADSTPVLEEEKKEKRESKRRSRPARHPVPETLETETVTLQPESTVCPHCGQEQHRIGEEVTEEFEYRPAKLIRRRTVRPEICLPVCGIQRGDRAVAAAVDSAEQAGVRLGGVSAVDAL